jgi:superfamily II DNA/RNA helicase
VQLLDVQSAQVIVGTSCAGTGLDISGAGHIVVVGLPFSIEQLLQWAGRCRTDGTISVFVPSLHLQKDDEIASKDAAFM